MGLGVGVAIELVLRIAQSAIPPLKADLDKVLAKYASPPLATKLLAPGGVVAGWMANSYPVVYGRMNWYAVGATTPAARAAFERVKMAASTYE
jgi:hypothetical protein